MNVLIYGHARSGTTVLACVLGQSPQLNKVVYEPFRSHPVGIREHHENKNDTNLFCQSVNKLWSEHDVIKSLTGEVPDHHLEIYFKSADKILLTTRRNVLQAAVSCSIAKQTQVWQAMKADKDYGEHVLKPLNLGHIEWLLKFYPNTTTYAKKILDRNGIEYHEVCYEDFFLSKDPIGEVKKLYDFLGIDMPKKLDRLKSLMVDNKLNTERVYLKIPNVYEIERRFGNNETGWLLNGGLQI